MKSKLVKRGLLCLGVFLNTSFSLLSADTGQDNNSNNQLVFGPQKFEKTREELVEWFPGCSENNWYGHFAASDQYYNFHQKTKDTVPVAYISNGYKTTLYLRENVQGLGKDIFADKIRWQYLRKDMLDFMEKGYLPNFPGLSFIQTVVMGFIRKKQANFFKAVQDLPESFQKFDSEKVLLQEEETSFNLETVLQLFYSIKKEPSFGNECFSKSISSLNSNRCELGHLKDLLFYLDFQPKEISPERLDLIQDLARLQKVWFFFTGDNEKMRMRVAIKDYRLNDFFDSVAVDYSRYYGSETMRKSNFDHDFQLLVKKYQNYLSKYQNLLSQLEVELLK